MISVLTKTRQQLVIAEKLAALGELTAGVAHEINNPTAVILGNIDVIIAEMGTQLEPVQDEIDLIIEQIYRIKDITTNLLQYAKPDDYGGYMNEIDVNQLVEETSKLVQHLRSDINYTLEISLGASILVRINRQELQQVLVNLITNSIQALPDTNGLVSLTSKNFGQKGVKIFVKDNGIGMDIDSASKVFNPFYTTKTQGEGTGLGLSISYGLVRRYGGNIEVTSELNSGTEFVITLLKVPVLLEHEDMLQQQLGELESL